MKPSRYLSVLLSSVMLVALTACAPREPAPRVSGGQIDLRGWDFSRRGPVELNGEWKYRWMGKGAGLADPALDDREWEPYTVPSFWVKVRSEEHGYAWFRATVLADTTRELGLRIRYMQTACTLYVNGVLAAEVGKAGVTKESTVPRLAPVFVRLPRTEKVTLALLVSNFHHARGGPRVAPVIAPWDDLALAGYRADIRDAVILGLLAMMSLYHLILWFARREDIASLFFSLLCLDIALRMSATGHLFSRLLPHHDVFAFGYALEYISISFGWVCMLTFIRRIFPAELNARLLGGFQVSGLVLSLVPLVAPVAFYSRYVMVYEFLLMAASLSVIVASIMAAKHGRDGAFLILSGFLVFFVTIVVDVMNVHGIMHIPYIAPYGLVFLVFSQSTVLSVRFARAHRTAEHLSRNLQIEVEAKTESLTRKTEEAMSARAELEGAYRALDTNYRTMKRDLELARTIQDGILPKNRTRIAGFTCHIEYLPVIEIGGDIYDIFDNNGTIRIFLADAIGHGIGAALITTLIKSEYDRVKGSSDPHRVFTRLNDIFAYNYPSLKIFFTGFIADINPEKGKLMYSSCGHPDQYLVRGGVIERLGQTGYAIGVQKESNATMKETSFTKGDRLFLFTDGLLDEFNRIREFFGEERVMDAIRAGGEKSIGGIIKELLSELKGFIGEGAMSDDLTIIGIE